jgi:hypothetical protein
MLHIVCNYGKLEYLAMDTPPPPVNIPINVLLRNVVVMDDN